MTYVVEGDIALTELQRELSTGLPELLADIGNLLRPQWPHYAHFLEENMPTIAELATLFVHRLLETARRGLASLDPVPPEAEPAVQLAFEQIGALQFTEGRDLAEVLPAYRVGARAAWRHVSAAALRLDLPSDVLAALAEAVFVFVDELASASTKGYVKQQLESGAERERLRAELSDLLLSDRSDSSAVHSAAERARWPLPSEAALVLVDPSDAAARTVIEHLDQRCLQVRKHNMFGVIVPGPVDSASKRELAARLRGANAIVGQYVGLDAFPLSTLLPLIGIELRRRGLLDGDPVFVSEHLDQFIVHRDEQIFDALRERVLHPLDDLAPATRGRLTETLASWLRHMGDHTRVAEQLFIHRQTVRYRMNQLRQRFGEELDCPRSRARLLLVLEWGPEP
jgi:PucR C-terminal helix-turn-helix domain